VAGTRNYPLRRERAGDLLKKLAEVPVEKLPEHLAVEVEHSGVRLRIEYHGEMLSVTWLRKPFYATETRVWAEVEQALAKYDLYSGLRQG